MAIDLSRLSDQLQQKLGNATPPPDGYQRTGCLLHVDTTMLIAHLPGACMGELCRIIPSGELAEVVAINGTEVSLSPFGLTTGMHSGQKVVPQGRRHRVPVGHALLGRVVDGLGRLLDGGEALDAPFRDYDTDPPSPLLRQMISAPLLTGVRSIDGFLTCGEGQRVGIFAAAGVGKSTLLAMLCDSSEAQVNVLAMMGERGREVREFLEQMLTPAARQRSVLVVSTSDRPALERMRALYTATTIAEAFRDEGKKVCLLVDSLTRYARASREIILAAKQGNAAGGYPPEVFATLPRLLERAGKGECGSITAFYTILVEGDDMNEPLADEVRSLLDGHIVLSRRLAEAGHFPAIDILASLSRVMPMVTSEEQQSLTNELRHLLATYREVELLVRVGEYEHGEDPQSDRALEVYPEICAFLQQKRKSEVCDLSELTEQLREIIHG